MPFNPFGKGFELETNLSVAEVREAIYERQRNRFAQGSGPKAVLVGSLILLWMPSFGALAQPQLICRVIAKPRGSRIRGYFGLGLLFTWFIATFFGVLIILAAFKGDFSDIVVVTVAALVLLLLTDTKSGEPLLRYLHNSLDQQVEAPNVRTTVQAFGDNISLEVGDTPRRPPITPQTIRDALLHLEEGGDTALFLFRRGTGSLQAMPEGAHFVLERRIEGDAGYQRAFRRDAVGIGSDRLPREEALAALLAHAAGDPLPETIDWRQAAPRRT